MTIYEDGEYRRNNPTWHVEDSPWKASHIERLLKDQSIEFASLCEVGCGAGEILVNLAKAFPAPTQFSGYEISPQAFAICKPKATEHLHFYDTSPLSETACEKPKYNVALAIDVFEHVEDYIGFLRQMKNLAEFKVFHVPLDLSVQTVLRAAPLERVRQVVGHLHFFTKETALATLEHAGYEIVAHKYTANSLELPNRGWKANLGRIPRHVLSAISQDLAVRVMGGYSLLVLAK
jgi:SAM-dependent methyltransferase